MSDIYGSVAGMFAYQVGFLREFIHIRYQSLEYLTILYQINIMYAYIYLFIDFFWEDNH